ncbi:MAG: M28 family peptidase, partial [Bacteroidetes bacterium]|nr:M28 family peptidase [Bacteroidota bacterium]
MPPNPQFIVEQLCQFPQRAVNSKEKEKIFEKLSRFIQDENVEITQQPFRTPRHFIQVLYWLFGGLITALLLSGYSPIIAMILATFFTILGIRYFDWRSSWLTRFPPLIECFNFIAKQPLENPKVKLVFMAHWDTAPITIPYRPSMIKSLRSSVFIGVGIMILCVVVSILSIWMDDNRLLTALKIGLLFYLTAQVIIISIDFWRFGYSNGANDNATGCAAAVNVANHFWRQNLPDCEVEVCITGAEEVGMVGAWFFYQSIKDSSIPTYVINFDTIGCEHLQVITQSGTFTNISYDHELLNYAREIAQTEKSPVRFQPYHTADVDTAWFARGGIQALTFISHNEEGLP